MKIYKGFTIIEVMMYVAVSSIVLLGVAGIMASYFMNSAQNTIQSVVDNDLQKSLLIVKQKISEAESFTVGASTVTLNYTSSPSVTIYLQSGKLYLNENSVDYQITHTNDVITAFDVQDLTDVDMKGILGVTITGEYNNTQGLNQFNYSKSVSANVSTL